MKRSSKQKALDVPATTVSANDEAITMNALSTRRKKSARAAVAKAKPGGRDDVPTCVEADLEALSDTPTLINEWEDEMTEDDDLWAAEFEADWDEDEDEDAIAEADYFEAEFDLNDEDDDELDADWEAAEASPEVRVRLMLERGLVSALAAPQSAPFFERLAQTLYQAAKKLQSPTRAHRVTHGRSSAQRNGHHPSLRQQVMAQPIQRDLQQLARLTQRYQKRGLGEFELLQDAIALFDGGDVKVLAPVFAGLAARIATQPSLQAVGKGWSAEWRSQLLSAAQKATHLLAREGNLATLPGLAANLGQRFSQTARTPSTWPQTFYQTACKVAASPQLQQRLMDFEPASTAQSLLINANEMPLKVRVNAPLEIVFRQPQGQ